MNACWPEQLDRAVDDRYGRMVEIRRHLHAHPEPSGEEHRTSLYLYQLLDDEGFQVRMGPEGRGVIADAPDLCGGGPAELIGLRADIDALRLNDQKKVEYRSTVPGVTHACGHDAHTALVWGAMGALGELARGGGLPWPIRVRGIFQTSEELCSGAKEMIEAGMLDSVGAMVAAHVDPTRRLGHVGLRVGVLTANSHHMRVKIIGRGGHAARPHEAADPIAAAAQFINAIYLFIPRVVDSRDAVVVTIGQIDGGHNPNVIPDRVELHGTLRTLSPQVHKQTIRHLRKLARGVGQTTETRIDVQFKLATDAVRNDADVVELLYKAASEVVGSDGIDVIPRPSMGAEDFAYYLDHVPGALFRLGCASDRVGDGPLHSSTFDVDEEALRIGAKIMARTVVLWSDPAHRCEHGSGHETAGAETGP